MHSTDMKRVQLAMRELGWLVSLNGRRLANAKAMARARWIRLEVTNMARYVPMAPRAERRKKQGKDFRPVYGYVGNTKALKAENDRLEALLS